MQAFEVFFLLCLLSASVTVIVIATCAIRGERGRAGRLAARLGAGLGLYVLALIGASLVVAPRVIEPGVPRCFDDWCIAVTSARWVATPEAQLEVGLRLSSRARQRPMGERGTFVYVLDGERRRYEAVEPSGEPSFDRPLQPGQSVETVRRFRVPADAGQLAMVYARSGFPIGWLIIGEEGWFQGPSTFRLDIAP